MVDDWRTDVGAQLRAIRDEQGLTRPVLARIADVAPTTIDSAEDGTIGQINKLNAIVAALGFRLVVACVPLESSFVRFSPEWLETQQSGSPPDGNSVKEGTTQTAVQPVDLRREKRPMTTWQQEALYALVRGLEHEDDQLAAMEYVRHLIWKRRGRPTTLPPPNIDDGSPSNPSPDKGS